MTYDPPTENPWDRDATPEEPPEEGEPEVQDYRGYTITRLWISRSSKPAPDSWSYVHDDYDGPEDGRAGFGPTAADCREQIDEADGIEPCPSCDGSDPDCYECDGTGAVRPFTNALGRPDNVPSNQPLPDYAETALSTIPPAPARRCECGHPTCSGEASHEITLKIRRGRSTTIRTTTAHRCVAGVAMYYSEIFGSVPTRLIESMSAEQIR